MTMNDPRPRTNSSLRRGAITVLWAIMSGLLLAVGLIVLVWLIEPQPLERRERHRDVDVTELVTPGSLSKEEREETNAKLESSAIKLELGAWVQVAGSDGELAQQYSADRIDPLPNGLLEMQRPRARIFLGGGRVLVLRGEHGLLDAPQQAIESGTLDGDVVIRLFSPKNGEKIDILNDDPEVIVRTEEASFDSNLGEIRCDGAIRVDSKEASFAGEGLTVLLGTSGRTIQRLMVDRATEPVRILRRQLGETVQDSNQVAATGGEALAAPAVVQDDAASAPLFYRLLLQDNVRIRRFVDETSKVPDALVRGQTLVTVFSLDGDGFSKATSPVKTAGDPFVRHPISRVDLLGASMLAGLQDEQAEVQQQLIEIDFDGPLVMTIAEPEEHPGSIDDLTVRIERGPERRVEIVDAATDAVATCSSLTYQSVIDRIELAGDDSEPLFVDSPEFQLRGRTFWLLREQGIGGLDGPGSMAFVGSKESSTPVNLSWTHGVNLEFEPESETLRRAVFDSGVLVESLDFSMRSERLDVRLGGGEEGSAPRLERILASGDESLPVRAKRTAQPGLLMARELDLTLRQDASGDPHPEHLVASGDVQASDQQQTIWADDLDVRFDRSDTSELVVGKLVASGDVELKLENGARAWGDRLVGSGVRRNVEISSSDGDVVLLRGNVIADSLRVIRFDDDEKVANSEGPGRFRFYEVPLLVADQGRASPPDLEAIKPSLEATWGRSMRFKDNENEGASALELEGDVIVRNRPDVLEENDLDAGFLRLDFAMRASTPIIDSEGLPLDANTREAFSNSRDLIALIAREGARMESRAWNDETHVGDPDLFRVEGDDIRYDATTGEAVVKGKGSLLMNRVPGSEASDSSSEASDSALSFGSDGTTRFSWTQGMSMKKTVADRYVISMAGEVEVLHAGLQNNDTLTLSSARLSVLIERPLESASTSTMKSDGGLDLGGQAEILRLTSSGQVYARTTDHDVQCERFEYDVANGIAELEAREGRMVTVVSRGSPNPVRANSMRWDMRSGRIQISGARGGVGR
jgi:hypothetical protein